MREEMVAKAIVLRSTLRSRMASLLTERNVGNVLRCGRHKLVRVRLCHRIDSFEELALGEHPIADGRDLPAPRFGKEQCWHLADVERAGDAVVHPWVTKLGQTPTVDADRNDLESKLGLEVP